MQQVHVRSRNYWACRKCGWVSGVPTGMGWSLAEMAELKNHLWWDHDEHWWDYEFPCVVFSAYQSTRQLGCVANVVSS